MNLVPLFPTARAAPRVSCWLSPKHRLWLVSTAGLALLLAGYLVYMKWTGQISHLRGCGGSEGCANLLGGRWGSWLLMPVSLWALLAYAGLIGLCAIGLNHWWSRMLAVFAGLLLLAAAIWFTLLQAVVERHFCLYCCLLHACGLLIGATLLQRLLTRDFPGRWTALRTAAGLTAAAMVALIVGQIWGPQPATHEVAELAAGEQTARGDPPSALPAAPDVLLPVAPSETTDAREPSPVTTRSEPMAPPPPAPQRTLSYLDGQVRYTLGELPFIGDPAADHILVEYFDYTCESCRDMQQELERIRLLYPKKFAVIVVPTPLNRSCNPNLLPSVRDHQYACELSRLGLAMWRAAPELFAEFHAELFRRQGGITPEQARRRALELVDAQTWEQAEQDPWIRDTLDQSARTYKLLCRQGPRMPKVLLGGNRFIQGVPRTSADLIRELQRQLSFD